jgi:hypothetical protein
VIDTATRFFLSFPVEADQGGHFSALKFSDPKFILQFEQPTSYSTLDGETWRLYSRVTQVNGRTIAIMVGYALKAPWKMLTVETPREIGIVDDKLRSQADQILQNLSPQRVPAKTRGSQRLSADGLEVVDPATGELITWGPWLPMFLPDNKPLPQPGSSLYFDGAEMYIVQSTTAGRLIATSLAPVGNVVWLMIEMTLAFVTTTLIARMLSKKFLRNYFALAGFTMPSLEEALKLGENENIEFKRAISTDTDRGGNTENELLKSITAFANTTGGVIFLGVDDNGHAKGLQLGAKQRDQLELKIRQLVRNHITPTPPIQVSFHPISETSVVAAVAVGRGDAPAYLFHGAIYVRYGSSDVQAQPNDLQRLITEYA